ncbi:MAG TPA: TonB-dependent receptor [Steroidobacteraceae bacterium]|nr:TonB-dependent receptor [Steroidobacteraceae bacterium]
MTRAIRGGAQWRHAGFLASWAITLALSQAALAQTTPPGAPAQGAQGTQSTQGSQSGPANITPATGTQDEPLQEVIVTATGTNIAGVAPVGSESMTLTRDDILSTGMTDLHDVLQTLPQVVNVAPAGVVNYQEGGTAGYSGANLTQGTSVNLRGLGPQATLVLVDGHRVTPTGTDGVFTEANQLPLSMVERVEIIDDGNSAIYGSDAIGGVVNYVVRKDLDGIEVSGRGTHQLGDSQEGGSITGGHTWTGLGSLGKGNFIIGVDYDHRSPMLQSASPLLSDDLSGYGGVNNEIRGGAATTGAVNGGVGPGQPGNIATPGATSNLAWCDNYSAGFPPFVPASCTSSTYLFRGLPTGGASTYAQTLANPSLADRADENDYLGRLWRWQVSMFANQDINDQVSIYFEGFWTRRDTLSQQSQYSSDVSPQVTVNPGSPYYIAPPSPAGGPMYVDLATSALGIPAFTTDNPDTNWTAVTGLKADLGHDWAADLSATVGRDKTCGECQSGDTLDIGALQYYVNNGTLNPLQTTPFTAAQLALFMGDNIQESWMGIEDYVLKFNGPLFDLPAGAVKLAAGGEFYHNTESIANGASRTDDPAEGIQESSLPPPLGYEGYGCSAPLPCPPRTEPDQFAWDNIDSSSRDVSSAFTELYVPLVSPANDVPLVKSLALDAAGRFDHYSDFGSTTNPKLGLTWKVNDDIAWRGSWGTSYRAPSLTDINPFVFSVKVYTGAFPNLTGNNSFGTQVAPGLNLANAAFILGNQPDLKPERARNWSTGFDLTPHWVEHLKANITYYNIDYTNQIFAPSVFPNALLSPSQYALYSTFVHPVHNPANCTPGNPSTYDPALLPFVNAVNIYGVVPATDFCQIQVWLDGRDTNIGSSTQGGVDFSVNYVLESRLGNWTTGLNLNKVTSERIAYVDTQPETSVLGTIGNMVPWRGRLSLGWNHGPWNVTLFTNYVGKYLNNTPITGQPDQEIASWTTFDLNVGFDLGRLDNPGWLAGTQVSLSAQNLAGRDPPLVLTAAGAGFDANNANPYGRIITLQATKRF